MQRTLKILREWWSEEDDDVWKEFFTHSHSTQCGKRKAFKTLKANWKFKLQKSHPSQHHDDEEENEKKKFIENFTKIFIRDM